ncbi:unnamed protein product [Bursaphelenchus xylophilus]|nr:unnamed protein product [Bursaphelenchus xylophilus]CAG9109072.1 unnamed protein product [Bursaphelenchus xylophilus]
MEIDRELNESQVVPDTDNMEVEETENSSKKYFTMANPQVVLFDEYWARLEGVVMDVMNDQLVDQAVWSNSFFDIYGLCSGQYTVDLYAKLIECLAERVRSIARDLYPLQGIELLESYSSSWNKFDSGINHVNGLCRYLNRMIVKEMNARVFTRRFPELENLLDGNRLAVCDAARRLWRKELILPLKRKLYGVIWSVIVQIRDGSYSEKPNPAVGKILLSFISVCFSSDDERDSVLGVLDPALCVKHNYPIPAQLKFYNEIFEDNFLIDNRTYFRGMLSESLANLNMFDYMSKVIKILENEEKLAADLLFTPTVKKLLVLLRKIFILEQLPRFDEVVPEYVRMEKKAELRLVYSLLDYFPDAAQILVTEYEKQIATSLENHLSGLFLTPSVFTEAASAKHSFYTKFNSEVFSDAPYIQAALRRAIESVLNKEREGEKFYAARMLARHMDLLLKKSQKKKEVGDDIYDKLDEAVTIFRYIKDKDTFHKIFQRMLAIRLLNKISISLELEEQMIFKLQEACGNEYTAKLSRMHDDCIKSRILNAQYHLIASPPFKESTFNIIQTCAWPVISSSEDPALKDLRIPSQLQTYSEEIRRYYDNKHTGRILKFAYHVSTGDLLFKIGSKRCIVTMTVPQAMLLLVFDKYDVRTISQLVESTKMSFEYVCSSLKSLIDFKILIVDQKQGCYTEETPVQVNLKFEALRSRVHLQPPTIVSKANESNPIPSARETLQDRKVAVECAIVRAMKAVKVMKHQDLIETVCTSIADRFVPDRPFLKQCIEGLIEKHFLQRTDNMDEYEYLP